TGAVEGDHDTTRNFASSLAGALTSLNTATVAPACSQEWTGLKILTERPGPVKAGHRICRALTPLQDLQSHASASVPFVPFWLSGKEIAINRPPLNKDCDAPY